ncbi:MAG: Uma2 family endonuclease [Candidatus Kapabacteria bacterium]|nr:Uma2 family endonuclease [Candidatus Kapabacteria bacterium]
MATLVKRTPRPQVVPIGEPRIRNGVVRLYRPKYDGLKMSLQDFLDWEPKPDGWKYEWNNGIVEVNEESMKNTERKMVRNISRAFIKTMAFEQFDAELYPETDCVLLSGQVRRPDIAYFTREQIEASARNEQPVPAFVMELISPNDKAYKLEQKLDEYFAASVACVWYIYPNLKQVNVYTSRTAVKICLDKTPCSAAPALDFTMTPNEIFA